jgi:hypothetical protein
MFRAGIVLSEINDEATKADAGLQRARGAPPVTMWH